HPAASRAGTPGPSGLPVLSSNALRGATLKSASPFRPPDVFLRFPRRVVALHGAVPGNLFAARISCRLTADHHPPAPHGRAYRDLSHNLSVRRGRPPLLQPPPP